MASQKRVLNGLTSITVCCYQGDCKTNFEGIFKWIAQEIEEKGLFYSTVNPSRISVNCALYFNVFFQRSHTNSLIQKMGGSSFVCYNCVWPWHQCAWSLYW